MLLIINLHMFPNHMSAIVLISVIYADHWDHFMLSGMNGF